MNVSMLIYLANVAGSLKEVACMVLLFSVLGLAIFVVPLVLLLYDDRDLLDKRQRVLAERTVKTILSTFAIALVVQTFVPSRATLLSMYVAPTLVEQGPAVLDKAVDRIEKLLKEKK